MGQHSALVRGEGRGVGGGEFDARILLTGKRGSRIFSRVGGWGVRLGVGLEG